MKTLFNLLLVLSLIVSTSCSKENSLAPDVKPKQTFTAANLVGNWIFESVLMVDGRKATTCDTDLLKSYGLVTLNIKNVTTSKMTFYTDCNTQNLLWEQERSYSYSNNIITLDNGDKFEIVDADKFDGETLKIKMIKALQSSMPIGGIFTLKKS